MGCDHNDDTELERPSREITHRFRDPPSLSQRVALPFVMVFVVVPARLRLYGGVSFPVRRPGRHRSRDRRRVRRFLRLEGEDRGAVRLQLNITPNFAVVWMVPRVDTSILRRVIKPYI